MTNPFNPFAHKSGAEIMATWQIRALDATRGKLQQVLFRAMANEYSGITSNTWLTLLRLINPDFTDAPLPGLIGYAKVMQSGRVVSEVVMDKMGTRRLQVVYQSKDEFVSDMRRLADRLKLNDVDRVAMFALLGKWIVADYRVGVNGEKLAS